MRKTMITAVLAAGVLASPVPVAAATTTCNSVDCLANVAQNVVAGAPCTPSVSYVFGLDADKNTLICSAQARWVPAGPLVGEAVVAMNCAVPGSTAQMRTNGNSWQAAVPGIPLLCAGPHGASQWVDFNAPA